MRPLLSLLALLLAAVLAGALLIDLSPAPPGGEGAIDVASVLGGDAAEGYERADGPRDFVFPADHGPHPGFRTEWWYFTGHLEAAGRRFGYQLTFFRSALAPPGERPASESAWASDQLYMAHFTVTDVDGERFHAFERFSREALGLAGARAEPLRVWLEDWSLESVRTTEAGAPGESSTWPLRLAARGSESGEDGALEVALDLVVTPLKPRVLQGERGYSRKGPEPGNASYYYAYPRLAAKGTLRLGERSFAVEGTSWLDREWSTSALGDELVGWDWFSLQLDDGREVMVYRLRREDGGFDPLSDASIVAADGSLERLPPEAVEIEVLARWSAPDGRATYPVAWRMRLGLPAEELELEIRALVPGQELRLAVRYWEGAVSVRGSDAADRAVTGRGYVELTGYAAGRDRATMRSSSASF